MRKYLILTWVLLAGLSLQAAENLTLNTVLSSAVGSFWEVQTTTCSYPNISGLPNNTANLVAPSGQTVINFGPTGHGGRIVLHGGPLKVDTLLMEDGTWLTTGTNVPFLFAQPVGTPGMPGYDEGGKLTIFNGGTIQSSAILAKNLILPKNYYSSIDIKNELRLDWDEPKVKNITLHNFGPNVPVINSDSETAGSGARFKTLPQSTDTEKDNPSPDGVQYYYLFK